MTIEKSMTAVSPYTWNRGIAPSTRSDPCAPAGNHAAAFDADLRHGLRDAVPEQIERHDRVHARIAPEDRELPRGVRGVRLDDDPSRTEDREKGDDEVGRVREHQGNADSAANPNHSQTGGEPVDCGRS